MQENKITILSTRKLRIESLKEALAAGISIEMIPFIETNAISSGNLKKQLNELSEKYISVLFTSANAVEAVMNIIGDKETEWRIYCTEPQTKKAVLKYFNEGRIAGTAANASELASLIVEGMPKTDFVFFCGDQHREELPAIMKQHGISLKQVVVYNTKLTPVELTEEYDGILFFSPTAVNSLFSMNKPKKETVFFAIGESTATELREHASNELIVADHPSEEWMIKKILERFLVGK